MDGMQELAELGSAYAKLVVFCDAAHAVAHELGESEIARELSLMIEASGRRIEQLTGVPGWDRITTGE